ncbi:hypothetical protein LAZ67_5002717, partial [Cordylochernes scorpioides]
MVRRWRSWFLEGRQNVHDDERSGRPVTATDNAAVATVRNVMEADRRVTIDEIMIRMPPGIKIGRSLIGTIMSDVLNFRKVCARWVPRLLSENHKQQRMEAARAFLEMNRRDGNQLFFRIVTGDESWVHHSTSETKRQTMVWKKPEESAPKKAKVTISAGKVMAIVFWDCKGVLLVDYLPPNITANAARYCEDLTKLRAAIKRKSPCLLSRKVLLAHDNARPHAARTTQTLLEKFKWEIFTHPPYYPDLSPSDFHLFPALKLHLGGKHFAMVDDEVQAEANHWLRRQDTAWYNSGIKKMLQRYQKCLDRNGVLDRLRFLPIKKMDQRTCIKFCVKNEIKCADAFRMLTVEYREATLDRRNVYRWYKMFSEGREDVSDEERAGRPSTSTTDEKINEVEKMILANRRITVREVAEDLNISIGSCHSIFINDLGMRRVAAKFVPKLLNCDQKQHRMNVANEMLDSVRDDPNLLQRVITGDEAWVYGYGVETKAQSSQWKLLHEPRPKKARQVRSNVKVLLTVFFDCRGVVHHEFLPQGRTVNKNYYLQVMRNLRE